MTLLIALIALAFVFDFINGFHDSANSIATVVSTRVLTPLQAVVWAAFFNFIAFTIFKSHGVADTVKGMVHGDIITIPLLIGALLGATVWNLLTWYIIAVLIINICKNLPVSKVDKYFRRLQLVSSALFSIGHGGNDAQKTMGIIWAGLICYTAQHPDAPRWLSTSGGSLPGWAAVGCYAAMGLGTMLGGWRIVKTMGQRITALKPFEGFCAETAGAITLFLVTSLKIPVSTTHTITGSIMGAGMTKRLSAVRWGVAGNIVWAWILTIPASAIMGAAAYYILEHFTKA
jgi:PiT family inorganic phosphate transporter